MTQVTVNLTDSFEDWRVKTNTLGTNQGDLATLTTTATNSMVAAMNEIHAGSGLGNVVDDTTPELGGNLDVLARTIITSTTNGNIAITPNGTGSIILDGLTHPQADGTNGQVLSTNGAGVLSFTNSITETSFTPTASQTTWTVSYVVGRISVFLNGIKLLNGTDFTASNGTSVVLTTGATTSDRIEFQVFA
jgi:hypothetical protein